MPSERLALLGGLVVDGLVVCEPAWPQDGVVQVELFDQGGRVSMRIEHTAVVLTRHFAIDAHGANEDQPLHALGVHGINDGACLLRQYSFWTAVTDCTVCARRIVFALASAASRKRR